MGTLYLRFSAVCKKIKGKRREGLMCCGGEEISWLQFETWLAEEVESIEILTEVANGTYSPASLKQDIEEWDKKGENIASH